MSKSGGHNSRNRMDCCCVSDLWKCVTSFDDAAFWDERENNHSTSSKKRSRTDIYMYDLNNWSTGRLFAYYVAC